MKNYAQLNAKNICIGIQQVHDEIKADGLIEIDNYDTNLLDRKYENGKWSEERFLSQKPEKAKTEMEKLSESALALSEAFATKYEEDINKDLKNSEVLATIYEALLEGGK